MKRMAIKNNEGYTLMEMIVSVFIIGSISAILLTNYRFFDQTGQANMAIHRLASDIRETQNKTMGLKVFTDGDRYEGGWGINFQKDSDKYTIFDDMNNDHIYNSGEEYSEITLEGKCTFTKLEGGNDMLNLNEGDTLDIIFVPPSATTSIMIDSSLYDITQIEINDNWGDNAKTIVINKFGLIDVKEEP